MGSPDTGTFGANPLDLPQMNFPDHINSLLRPASAGKPLVLDLFAGCGGLALGFEAQGFETLGFEMDADCCATYRRNLHGDCIQVKLDADCAFPKAQVVIGGPPCQPFSVGGHHGKFKGSETSKFNQIGTEVLLLLGYGIAAA